MNKLSEITFQSRLKMDRIAKEKIVTWKEIKNAVEQAGIHEEDDIDLIQCEGSSGDNTFRKMRLGNKLKLTENVLPDKAREDAERCAV